MQVPEFDYVVIGGGAGGCVVASRLSEDPPGFGLLAGSRWARHLGAHPRTAGFCRHRRARYSQLELQQRAEVGLP